MPIASPCLASEGIWTEVWYTADLEEEQYGSLATETTICEMVLAL